MSPLVRTHVLVLLACGSVATGCASVSPRPELVAVQRAGSDRFILNGPDEASVQAKAASLCLGPPKVIAFRHRSDADLHPRKVLGATQGTVVDDRSTVQHEIACGSPS